MFYFDIFSELYRRKVKYLLVGGLSVNLYGIPRVTQDVDIIISFDKENVIKLVELLKDLHYLPRQPINPLDLANDKIREVWIREKNMKVFNFYHQLKNYRVLDVVLLHPLDFEKSYKNRIVKKVKNIEIYMVSIDDLISMKKYSGREQDLSDINLLEKIKQMEKNNNG